MLYRSIFWFPSALHRSIFRVCALHVTFGVCLRSIGHFFLGLSTLPRSLFFGSVYALQVIFRGLSTPYSSIFGLSVLHRSLFGVCLRFAGQFSGLPALHRSMGLSPLLVYRSIFWPVYAPRVTFFWFVYVAQVSFWFPSTLYKSFLGVCLRSTGQIWGLSTLYRSIFRLQLRSTGQFLVSVCALQVNISDLSTLYRSNLGSVYALQQVNFFGSVYAPQVNFSFLPTPYRSIVSGLPTIHRSMGLSPLCRSPFFWSVYVLQVKFFRVCLSSAGQLFRVCLRSTGHFRVSLRFTGQFLGPVCALQLTFF